MILSANPIDFTSLVTGAVLDVVPLGEPLVGDHHFHDDNVPIGILCRHPSAVSQPLANQHAMIAEGWARKTINKQIGRVVRMFSWAESKEMVPRGHTAALREVPGLAAGRTVARESAPVLPVADEVVQQTLPHLPDAVPDMVRLQRMTGARPEEICIVRPCDIDTSGDVWSYVTESHKTQHHGKRRVIFIGPRAQAVLRPYLLRSCESYCFSPADNSQRHFDAQGSANRGAASRRCFAKRPHTARRNAAGTTVCRRKFFGPEPAP